MKNIRYVPVQKARIYGFFGVLLGFCLAHGYYRNTQTVIEEKVRPVYEASIIPSPAAPVEKGYADYLDEVLETAEALSPARRDMILDYHDLAKREQDYFGIPTSVKLAQMILEGGFNDDNPDGSFLVRYYNNPFGIKYYRDYYPRRVPKDSWDKLVHKGEYGKYYDDCGDQRCKFMHFQSMWSAIRFHSYFLAGNEKDRSVYYVEGDWKDWVRSLQKNGYATNDDYAKALTRIIENYKLHLLDK